VGVRSLTPGYSRYHGKGGVSSGERILLKEINLRKEQSFLENAGLVILED